MMIKQLLLLLCFVFSCLAEEAAPPEIRVHLATNHALESLYLGDIRAQETPFDAAYLKELRAVLAHDFNYNGSTLLVKQSSDKELLLQDKPQVAHWKDGGIAYVISPLMQGRQLSLSILAVAEQSLKTFSNIAITGDLQKDRRQMHKVADSIYKALFQEEGIANSRILFAYQTEQPRSDGSGWVSEIWECDWDGANLRQLTHESSYCVTPVLFPKAKNFNNDSFLYVSYKMGQPKIYIGSLQNGQGKRLIDLRGNQLLPAISPERDKLAFICDAAGRADLFLQKLDPKSGKVDKPQQLFSYPRSTTASPTFSPDGAKIAFVSDKDGGMRIFILSASATEKRQTPLMVSKKNRENSCPSWSPDGKKLAYSAKTNGIRQIWIYDLSSAEETQLTTGPGNKENPCWAPNSCHLVFNSTDHESSELYMVNLHQPEAVKISRGPGKKHYPTWGMR